MQWKRRFWAIKRFNTTGTSLDYHVLHALYLSVSDIDL